jgi:hypothetical protein
MRYWARKRVTDDELHDALDASYRHMVYTHCLTSDEQLQRELRDITARAESLKEESPPRTSVIIRASACLLYLLLAGIVPLAFAGGSAGVSIAVVSCIVVGVAGFYAVGRGAGFYAVGRGGREPVAVQDRERNPDVWDP